MALTDDELVERFAPYAVDHDTKDFYRGWLDHELRMNRCTSCGNWHHPPRPMCPACWSTDLTPTAVSGRGTIYLLILLHQGPPAPGVDYAVGPHPVVTVELVEQTGLRFTSTVVDVDPGDLAIGQAVELVWLDRDGMPFPAFRLTEGAGA